MDKTQIENQIDRFIQNEMMLDERRQFCLLLEEDEELKQLVSVRYSLMEGMLQSAEQKAKRVLECSTHRRKHRVVQWAAVACVLFLIGGGIWFGNSFQYTPQNIYLNYHHIPTIERARGGNGLIGEVARLNEYIISLYERRDYIKIVELINISHSRIILKDLPDYTLLYAGISLLEQNELVKANSILSQIHDSEYQNEADWLLLCCYLKGNERQQAIRQAQKIQTGKGEYINAAKQIEIDLKKKKWF